MALSETIEYDKIQVVGQYKHVEVRKASVIKKDDVEITRSFERYVLEPDHDISEQPTEVKDICNLVWTDNIKEEWKKYKIASAETY